MNFKAILFGAMAFSMVASNGQAAQRQNSNGKRIAKATLPEEQVSKFATFSNHDDYPQDALYNSIWTSERVNPYNEEIPDSFLIVTTGFEAPTENRVTSEYGPRWGRFHAGIDIAVNKGDSIRAAFDGQVRIAHKFDKQGYGWYVVIRHDNGLETLYGHLSKPLATDNQRVKAGDVIGLGGSTGRSTGPHLHFETRFLGIPMDPRNIIDFDNNVIMSDTYVIRKLESFEKYNRYKGLYRAHYRKKYGKFAEASIDRNGRSVHIVRSGDNLSCIARKYGTTVSRLCSLNNISPTAILSLGKRLYVK